METREDPNLRRALTMLEGRVHGVEDLIPLWAFYGPWEESPEMETLTIPWWLSDK